MTEMITTKQLAAGGWGTREIASMVRDGKLVRLRRGVYRWASETEQAQDDVALGETKRLDHVERIRALVPRMSGKTVFSHASAAALHKIPLRYAQYDELRATRGDRTSGLARAGLRISSATLPDDQVTTVDGIRCTTAARTACDLARRESLAWGVVALDDVLHRRLATREELEVIALMQAHWGGHRPLARALALADGRSESVGESISRVRMHEAGLAPDAVQVEFTIEGAQYRADFFWRCGVVGEFDGRGKYGDQGDAVWREKQREDAFRRAGYEVVRWTWDEIFNTPHVVLARIREKLALKKRAVAA